MHNITSCLFNILDSGIVDIKDVRKQKHKTKKQNVKGLLGRELTSQGYVNIDGLDKSLGMLGQVRQW